MSWGSSSVQTDTTGFFLLLLWKTPTVIFAASPQDGMALFLFASIDQDGLR
jgi:hypothetical protein